MLRKILYEKYLRDSISLVGHFGFFSGLHVESMLAAKFSYPLFLDIVGI